MFPLAKAILIHDACLVLLPHEPQGMIAIMDKDQASFLCCQGALSVGEHEGIILRFQRDFSDQSRKCEHQDWGVSREDSFNKTESRVVMEGWLVTQMRYRSMSRYTIKAKLR